MDGALRESGALARLDLLMGRMKTPVQLPLSAFIASPG